MVAHPRERPLQRGQERLDLGVGEPGTPRVVQQAHPERGRVDRAVVQRRQRDLVVVDRQGRLAQLVHDLAGLLGGRRVVAGALQGGEDPERAAGGARVDGQQEPGGPDRVAAEQREEPGGAGGDELALRPCEPERVEVVRRPLEPPPEPVVPHVGRCVERTRGPHPGHHGVGGRTAQSQPSSTSCARPTRHRSTTSSPSTVTAAPGASSRTSTDPAVHVAWAPSAVGVTGTRPRPAFTASIPAASGRIRTVTSSGSTPAAVPRRRSVTRNRSDTPSMRTVRRRSSRTSGSAPAPSSPRRSPLNTTARAPDGTTATGSTSVPATRTSTPATNRWSPVQ